MEYLNPSNLFFVFTDNTFIQFMSVDDQLRVHERPYLPPQVAYSVGLITLEQFKALEDLKSAEKKCYDAQKRVREAFPDDEEMDCSD
jgi:hypothetical protein